MFLDNTIPYKDALILNDLRMGVAEYKSFLNMHRVPFDVPSVSYYDPNERFKLADVVQEPSRIYQKANFPCIDLPRFTRRSQQLS